MRAHPARPRWWKSHETSPCAPGSSTTSRAPSGIIYCTEQRVARRLTTRGAGRETRGRHARLSAGAIRAEAAPARLPGGARAAGAAPPPSALLPGSSRIGRHSPAGSLTSLPSFAGRQPRGVGAGLHSPTIRYSVGTSPSGSCLGASPNMTQRPWGRGCGVRFLRGSHESKHLARTRCRGPLWDSPPARTSQRPSI
jgi:hypothetical protein